MLGEISADVCGRNERQTEAQKKRKKKEKAETLL
jgi:hypothetical protein